jgi:hypothetical protein
MKTIGMAAAGLGVAALILGGAAAVAPPAVAQPKGEARAALLTKLVDCRKLTDNAARLACYDAATAALDQAEQKGDVVVIDRDKAREVRKQAFGFTLPSISIFEKGEAKEDVENMTGVVASAHVNSQGQWVVKLQDGAVWQQVDNNELFKTPKDGMPVKIRKASLGSYLMIIDNQRAVRAHRVE